MRRIGKLAGRGQLVTGNETASVFYSIDVWSNGYSKSGDGALEGKYSDMFDAMSKAESSLRLESGEHIKVVINQLNADQARFLVSGPIPGF